MLNSAAGGFPAKLLKILGAGKLLEILPPPTPGTRQPWREKPPKEKPSCSPPAHGINQGEVAVGLENGGFLPKSQSALGMPIPARLSEDALDSVRLLLCRPG